MSRVRSEIFPAWQNGDIGTFGDFRGFRMTLKEAMFWFWRVRKLRVNGTITFEVPDGAVPDDCAFDQVISSGNHREVESMTVGGISDSINGVSFLGNGFTVDVTVGDNLTLHDETAALTDGWYIENVASVDYPGSELGNTTLASPGDSSGARIRLLGADPYFSATYDRDFPLFVTGGTKAYGTMTIEAVEFWPFDLEDASEPIYDTSDGSVLTGMSPHIGP